MRRMCVILEAPDAPVLLEESIIGMTLDGKYRRLWIVDCFPVDEDDPFNIPGWDLA